MPVGVLKKASRLLRARKYDNVIRFLEPLVYQYRESFEYYYLLGRACLYGGDWRGAESYLERASALSGTGERDKIGARVGLTFLMLRSGRKEQALRSWLRILDEDPGNRAAKRGLELVRRGHEPATIVDHPRWAARLMPAPPVRARPLVLAALLAALVAGAVLLALDPAPILAAVRSVRPTRTTRELPPFDLPSTPLITTSDALYVLSEREVRSTFERARRLFAAYRDNQACVELNRLLLSNAEQGVKARALMLKDHVETPDFTTLKRSASYDGVTAEPGLHDGCFVLWNGRVANLSVGTDVIVFELLVGYERGTELQGVVPASMSFASSIKAGDNVQVVGRVGRLQDGSLALAVVSIRRILAE